MCRPQEGMALNSSRYALSAGKDIQMKTGRHGTFQKGTNREIRENGQALKEGRHFNSSAKKEVNPRAENRAKLGSARGYASVLVVEIFITFVYAEVSTRKERGGKRGGAENFLLGKGTAAFTYPDGNRERMCQSGQKKTAGEVARGR